MPRNGGYIYATTDANGNKVGINTDEISAVTGKNSHNVGVLGRSEKVKKWNKNKPYRRTTPEVPSRTVDNWANGTGKYSGNRGETIGFPVYWGMQYPMNTGQQNASGSSRNNLWELCHNVIQGKGNHPNYEYMKPVAGVDFCAEDDFDGYYQDNGPFLDAGILGAVAGDNTFATIKLNKFDDSMMTVYCEVPPDSAGWELRDIIPEAGQYYLVAEFYEDNGVLFANKTSATPFVVKYPIIAMSTNMPRISFSVKIGDIMSFMSQKPTSDFNLYVCVGFNKLSSTGFSSGAGFIAPWDPKAIKFMTRVWVQQGSPYFITLTKYAWSNSNTYQSFPSSPIKAQTPTLKFEASVYNSGSNPLHLYLRGHAQQNSLVFRARAVGSYGDYARYNEFHLSNGGNAYNGAWVDLEVATDSDMSSSVNNVTINSKETKTVYLRANDILPYGYTTQLIIQVSNDNGSTWEDCGSGMAYFNRLNA
ncbi:MAG: hypothetical protein K2K45_05140 [Muribaculaceae bacterium]|nr:hypothetical protein [Muribaculaceae bacterium]